MKNANCINFHIFVTNTFHEKNIFYNKAQYVVDTDRKTPEEIVEEITTILQLHP